MITLGEPVLTALVYEGASPHVRDYWGYTTGWQSGKTGPFGFLGPDENRLDRIVFPFPHQPSIRKRFYSERLQDYTAFVRSMLAQNRARTMYSTANSLNCEAFIDIPAHSTRGDCGPCPT